MTSYATKVRTDLYELIERRLFELKVENLVEFQRRYKGEQLFDEPLCPFINRLCPDDLCYLPAGHVGAVNGYHITGTTAYNYAEKWKYAKTDMGAVGSTREELISMGVKLQGINE